MSTNRPAWSLTTEPWEHQYDAYETLGTLWQSRPGIALFSDVGTGKSLVALALWRAYNFRRVLLISGSKAMVPDWQEMAADVGLWLVQLDGSTIKRTEMLDMAYDRPDERLGFVTNVEAIWREPLASALLARHWDAIFVDESQRLKSAGSKSSLFAARLGRRTPYRLIMTGTPFHDKPTDIYGQFRFLDPTIFGTRKDEFYARYTIQRPLESGGLYVVGYRNQDELSEKVAEVSFRVDRSVLNLDEPVETKRTVRLTGKDAKLYASLHDEFAFELADGSYLVAANALAQRTRLQQMTSGSVPIKDADGSDKTYLTANPKLDALVELLEEIDPVEPVVVFGRFSFDLTNAQTAAAKTGRPYFELSGDRSEWREWRDRVKERGAYSGSVLGVQVQSGNAGINLTAARYAIFLSYPASLGDYKQCIGRVNRPGQREAPAIIGIESAGSVDVHVGKLLRKKEELSVAALAALMGKTGSGATREPVR